MPRHYFDVAHRPQGWAVEFDVQLDAYINHTQQAALEAARDAGHRNWQSGRPSGVRIQGADGRWLDESTYGNDPFPPRG
jgi:hypothetical protein